MNFYCRGEWCDEEDIELINHIFKLGKKWSQISREMNGRNEYSVKNRFYYLMKIHKLDANSVSNEEMAKIIEKKKELIEAKHQKTLKYQSLMNTNGQTAQNPVLTNNLNIQNLLFNYQSFVNFQSFCMYRKNMENFFGSMQRMINPNGLIFKFFNSLNFYHIFTKLVNTMNLNMNMKMEEEMKRRSLFEENIANANIKKEDGDNKESETVFPTNMMGSIPNVFPNLNEMALPNVLRNLNMFNNKIGAPF